MSVYLEAMLLLLPPDVGGRWLPVAPREGSYRPFVRVGERITRARLLEGPPLLAPGDAARVMLEVESDTLAIDTGGEYPIFEVCPEVSGGVDDRTVGIVTVLRVCGRTISV